jgi:hypothetical protein
MTATALSVKAGSPKAPSIDKDSCTELKAQNETQRSKSEQGLKKALKNPKKLSATERESLKDALQKVRGGGATFSSAKVNVNTSCGGKLTGQPTASSSGKAQEKNPAMVSGGTPDMKTGKEAVMCKPPTFKHPEGGAGGHGEAKIFNEMTERINKQKPGCSMSGGSVLLNIDWRYTLPSTGKTAYRSGMPCRTCFKMLCHAATRCKIEIFICDEQNQPQSIADHCKNKKKGYLDLDRKIDNKAGTREFRHGRGDL